VTADFCEAHWLEPARPVALRELAEASGLSEAEIVELVEYGALAPSDATAAQWTFSVREITVARTAHRLREDFALEAHAVALMLAYRERIRELEKALQALRARAGLGA
jgi:chaperone modulatory protein CbpM